MALISSLCQNLFCLVLGMVLALAPMANAASHGPGAEVVADDHASWHAEIAADRAIPQDHSNHDATEHDHASMAVLESRPGLEAPDLVMLLSNLAVALDEVMQSGLRRPPRLTAI